MAILTIEELRSFASGAVERVDHLGEFLKIGERREEMAMLNEKMAAPDFWDHKEDAQNTVAALSAAKNVIEPYEKVQKEIGDLDELIEMAAEDEEMLVEVSNMVTDLQKELDQLELVSFLSGELDHNNAYFSIHAGAGGTESCDWASILMRMYRRYFERCGWKDEVLDLQPGEEAGIKSVTLKVTGEFAYGYLKAERGVHRLVRISPFDSAGRRHTSFTAVEVMPEVEHDNDIQIDEKDLKVDTYRSTGAGGQHINTTDSAVRITHMPTGIVVQCQSERSQIQNRATCMKMLTSKLVELKIKEHEQEMAALQGEQQDIGWGSQIRSYVFHPYSMAKDHRTNIEKGNIQAVMDGDINDFIQGYLKQMAARSIQKQ